MKKIGIYIINSTKDSKFYIGSSINVLDRFKKHKILLRGNRHHNKYLQHTWNKYGEQILTFNILEEVFFKDTFSKQYIKEYLESLEQYYIDSTNACIIGYNISRTTDRPNVIRTEESLEKARRTRIFRGTTMTQDTKDKIRESLKNSEKCKLQRSKMQKEKRIKIYEYNLYGNYIKEWTDFEEVYKAYKIHRVQLFGLIYGNNRQESGRMFKNYKVDKIDEFIESPLKGKRKLRRYLILKNENGNILNIYDNRDECAQDLGIKKNNLSNKIRDKNKIQGKFYLSYGEYHK